MTGRMSGIKVWGLSGTCDAVLKRQALVDMISPYPARKAFLLKDHVWISGNLSLSSMIQLCNRME